MPQHELLACAQCGCFAFSCFEDLAIRVKMEPFEIMLGNPSFVNMNNLLYNYRTITIFELCMQQIGDSIPWRGELRAEFSPCVGQP